MVRKTALLVVISLILCGLLISCGQKGPLYLPGPDTPQEKPQKN